MKKKKRPEPEPDVTPRKPEPYRLFAHPLFLAQLRTLEEEVERLKAKDPANFHKKNASKRLAAITHLIYEVIPADPSRPEYRQGHTLGAGHTHWFRAKFFQQYRLFFRYDATSRVIVYAWVNDEETLRAYGSRDDAYAVFKSMLDGGNPPGTWAALVATSKDLALPFTDAEEVQDVENSAESYAQSSKNE